MNEEFCILIKISLKFVPKGLTYNNPALVLDNGLTPNRRQASIWTNADLIHWHIYAALGGDELIGKLIPIDQKYYIYVKNHLFLPLSDCCCLCFVLWFYINIGQL